MRLSNDQLQQLVARLVQAPELWRPLVRHDRSARVYEQIWDDDDVNAWLICWSEDHDTGFHDHDDSAAVIAVVDGQIREERLRLGSDPSRRTLGSGATVVVEPTAIHRVLHVGDRPAITIHAYSPPLRRTGTYRIGAAGELERTSQGYEHELRPGADRSQLGPTSPAPICGDSTLVPEPSSAFS